MRKLLLFALVAISIFLGYSFGFGKGNNPISDLTRPRQEILRVGLVADSHNENDLLEKALSEANAKNVDFVIGLGDYTNLGFLDELNDARDVFEASGLEYFVIAGDRDGWDSREKGFSNSSNFISVFGRNSQVFEREKVKFVLVDNSDLYGGINDSDWEGLREAVSSNSTSPEVLTFVFAHKTPFHPQSSHIMGEDDSKVAVQAEDFLMLLEDGEADGFFSGDIHFFARFNSPLGSVRITTIGAVASERNFQGPRFAILKVFDDYSWEVEDISVL